MKKLVKIAAKPKLKAPVMIAAWPGIGNVAMLVANYLLDKLEFKDLAEIDARPAEGTATDSLLAVVARDGTPAAPLSAALARLPAYSLVARRYSRSD